MSEPKTLPQSFVVEPNNLPNAAHAAWLDYTERLLAAFERSLPAQSGGPRELGFVLLAADHVWDQQPEQADFAQLDVRGLVTRCHPLLCGAGVAASCATTLATFYAFLASIDEIDVGVAAAISAQLLALPEEFERRS
jgi:hypothetical protein